MRTITLIFVSICLLSAAIPAQDVINLKNPSFEDLPRTGTLNGKGPEGWSDCGPRNYTVVDIQPGAYNVEQKAQDGETYVGMVVRQNETVEGISQKLEATLKKGVTYSFDIYLAKSEVYLSHAMRKGVMTETNFNQASVLRVYAGNSECAKEELLVESPLIDHAGWKSYTLEFTPEKDYSHFYLQAFYKTPVLKAYDGNLLMDNCSAIRILSK